MLMNKLLSCLPLFLVTNLMGQVLPPHVEFEELGLSFDIPTGWSGQIEGDYIYLGHQTIPGLMILSENNSKNTADLKILAEQGINDQAVNLKPIGDFSTIGNNRVEGMYEGMFDGASAKCYAIGLINGLGKGVNVLLVADASVYSDQEHKAEARKMANSIRFFEARETAATKALKSKIIGKQLKYMYTSSSSDYTGGYSGTSVTTTIDLCSGGQFHYYSNSNSSFSAGGIDSEGSTVSDVGSGYVNSNANEQGVYTIFSVANKSYLTLNFESGEVYEYQISESAESETFLNGDRFFVIESEACR